VSPALAAEAASRLFLRVPRVPRPRGESAAFLASGERFPVAHAGVRLAAWTWGRGPAVVLVHGWGGRGAQMRAFVPALVAAGYRAVAFDGPAHGASAGRSTSLPAFADAITAVVRAADARAVIAHSMGGASTLLALSRGLPLSRAVFLAAPSSPERIWNRYASALGLPGPVAAGARRRLEGRVGTLFAELGAMHVAPRVATPVLVVHDADDAEVPWASGDEIARALSGARLETTHGLGHRRILRDAGVVARAVGFLEEDVVPARCAGCKHALGTAGTDDFCGTCVLGRELFERGRRFAA
jgi:pimeloyl-ACP methyl ester carboxylesterase